MKAVLLNGFGGLDVLTLAETTMPKPKENEILVRVRATSLNRADILQRKGKYPPPPGESEILGLDIAGEVAELGSQVKNFQLGQRVFGLVSGGGYAEYACIDAEMAMEISSSMDFLTAAAIPEIFITAHESMIETGQLKPHQIVLIHAAGSGVGTACLQLAKALQCEIFVTAGSQEKIEKLIYMGARAGFNYKIDDFAAEILKLTHNNGVDVIEDFSGAGFLEKNLKLLKTNGHLVMLALMGGAKTEINLVSVLQKRLHLHGFTLRSRTLEEKRASTQRFAQTWLPKLVSGELKPIIDKIFSLTEIQKAHEYMEQNLNFGKIVIEI